LYRANLYKAKKDTARAFKFAHKALEEDPGFEEAVKCLGSWYVDANKHLNAARIFAGAARTKSNGHFIIPAAHAYLRAGMPDSALALVSSSGTPNTETKKIMEDAKMAIACRTPRDTNQVYKLDQRVNTPRAEYFPTLSSDQKRLYFTRRNNGVNEDFFRADADSCGGWFTARNMGYPPNTAAQEAAMTISSDDHYLFFMRGENRSENGWGRGGYDLYLSYRSGPDVDWVPAESFGATINTPGFEGMPSLSADVSEMYFVSDRPGGYGGLDIWMSRYTGGLWQMPVNLGPQINTAGNETAPFICSDGKTLFFVSDGHPGMGGTDFFLARKVADSIWKDLSNLGAPINSSSNEHSIYVLPDGRQAYFASDRDGSPDIFYTTLPKDLLPESTVFSYCRIYDSLSKEPSMLGSITIFDTAGNQIAQYHANKGDGTVLISLPPHHDFKYQVRAFNSTVTEGTFRFDTSCTPWCNFNFAVLPNSYVRPSYDSLLLLLQFPKNVTELSDSQKVQIHTALAAWKGKSDISIFANGFTDNTGTPMINVEKSSIRANNVAKEIENSGFSPAIISATGFGDESPLVPNDTPEGQDQNRRVELVVRWME
jgi:Tol biopolymer transport system component